MTSSLPGEPHGLPGTGEVHGCLMFHFWFKGRILVYRADEDTPFAGGKLVNPINQYIVVDIFECSEGNCNSSQLLSLVLEIIFSGLQSIIMDLQ